ncbi:WD40-repeat-containing domain protein [Russula dissimulans]|nr:WD40-repeat-containing domain protein [Russula dissimulans]
MVKYVLQKTLFKHSDSINALAFTHDGSLFASGADDGLIVVFKGNGHAQEVRRFQMKAPITTLLWHSRFGYTIIAGDACGDVHTICLNNSTNRNTYYHTFNSVSGPVHSIVQSGTLLAIGSGNAVELIKQGTIATWEVISRLPDPPKFPELEGELPDPMARSLHFLGASNEVLLVTYLDHGVIAWDLKTLEIRWRIRPRSCKMGCSAISPNQKILAVTNLYDGIDWYSLDSNHFMDTPFQNTTPHTISENVILPLTFIHNGTAVLSGTSTGCARITSLKDHSLVESLQHDSGDIVQAVAYSTGDFRQIITGVSERGLATAIKYWIQPRRMQPVQPRSKSAKEKMVELLEFFIGRTRRVALAIAIVTCILIFQYRDVQHITHLAWEWFSEALGISSSFIDSSPKFTTFPRDNPEDCLWSNQPSGTLRT